MRNSRTIRHIEWSLIASESNDCPNYPPHGEQGLDLGCVPLIVTGSAGSSVQPQRAK